MPGSVLIAKDRKMNNTDSLSSMARSPFGRQKWKRSWKTKKLQPQRYIQNILGKKKIEEEQSTQARGEGEISGKASWRRGRQS